MEAMNSIGPDGSVHADSLDTTGSPQPTVGRIVHYVSYGTPGGEYKSQCRAAIITEVEDLDVQGAQNVPTTDVALAVLNPTGIFLNQHVRNDEDDHRGGTWHWPERTP